MRGPALNLLLLFFAVRRGQPAGKPSAVSARCSNCPTPALPWACIRPQRGATPPYPAGGPTQKKGKEIRSQLYCVREV